VARPSLQSRKLILETSFAVKKDFSKFEATSWAVQELKRRGLKRLFKPVTSTAYERLVRSFYENLKYDCNRPDVLTSSIDDIDVEVTVADIAAALKCSAEQPEADNQWIARPPMLTVEHIVLDMCEGQFADRHKNAATKSRLPPQLWFVDNVLQKNVCPLGHKTQRRDLFLTALYSFYRGHWCSIPEIIWTQLHKFWDGVHYRASDITRSWGLPFPFLITYMLRKKGIKGTPDDGPITEHPQFGRIQWNQSYSHMPREHRARALHEPEMMHMDEPAAAEPGEPPVEPHVADEEGAETEQEETITLRASDFEALQDTLEDIRFQIADIQRDVRQDRLETQDLLRAILGRLPPAP
jgi:hypothetical protein